MSDEIPEATASNTTSLANISAGQRGLRLTNLQDMQTAAQIILQSGLCPDGFATTAQVFVALQTGAEMGLQPMQSLASLYVIKGRCTLWGDAALGLVKRSGLCEYVTEAVEGEGDDMVATVVSRRVGDDAEVVTVFTAKDAKIAGLWGKAGTWKTHPKRMLKYKARAFNLRDNFPDVLYGMHLTEEMEGEPVLPAPKCDTPPRDDRRKKIQSTDTDSNTGTEAEPAAPEAPSPPSEAEGAVGIIIYEEVLDLFRTKGGNETFEEFAAEILFCDEEEVSKPEQFTLFQLNQLKRALEAKG